MSHYVYIIKSKTNSRYYYGETRDIEERVKRHKENRSEATKNRGPWELIIYHVCDNRKIALEIEKKIKKMKNPKKAIIIYI